MIFTGLAPLFLSVSESQLQTISAVGAGLLIGTALGVILPEGSEAFRTAQHETSMSCLESQPCTDVLQITILRNYGADNHPQQVCPHKIDIRKCRW
jgi:hypothetical protein